MEDPTYTSGALKYAAQKWNESRHAAFREAIDSIRAYYLGCSDESRLVDLEDLISGFEQVAVKGLYDLETGDLADQSLPYRPNWYK